ncbi:MAG: phosphoserine phosphatase SerB [Neisseria sp.]|nr:phosphoserine phosphatase SerB [Neisseria sp.]
MKPTVLIVYADHLMQRLPENLLAALPVPIFRSDCVLRFPVADGFRLPENIAAALHAAQIDHAILPDMAFSELGLIVSDMDSTLITIECVDEIAARLGLKEQVAAITEQSMRGEIDFTQSLRARVALLAGLPESELQTVYDEVLQLSPGTAELMAACKRHQVKFMLISGGFTFFTERLQTRLGLDFAYANQLESRDGKLSGQLLGHIIDAQAKRDLLQEKRELLQLRAQQVLAVGDGANDIPMLQAAGIGVAYRAKLKTKTAADCAIDFGGLEGIVRLFRDE